MAASSFCGNLCGEFSLSKLPLSLNSSERDLFGMSPFFLKSPGIFAAWRTLATLYLIIIFAVEIEEQVRAKNAPWILIFVTYWSLVVQILYLSLATVLTWSTAGSDFETLHGKQSQTTKETAPGFIQAIWVLQNVSVPSSLLVALLYWGLVYTPEQPVTFGNVNVHGVNFVINATDLFLSGSQFRLIHVYQPFIFGIVYYIFTLIHFGAGIDNGNREGTNIYPILDYPSGNVFSFFIAPIAVTVGIPIFYFICWLIYYGGRAAGKSVASSSANDNDLELAISTGIVVGRGLEHESDAKVIGS